jgi:hypothetical protein
MLSDAAAAISSPVVLALPSTRAITWREPPVGHAL